jgi:II/X family phage/plasmid replication protein
MIDMLVLRCEFAKIQNINSNFPDLIWPDFKINSLEIPVEQSIDRDGEVFNTRHAWESIPSSYESMAFKVFDHRFDSLDTFYIEIKASPAKIMQGHNVYGSSDFYDCTMHLWELLAYAYPSMFDKLDHLTWSLAQIDITYSTCAKDNHEAKFFINALGNVSFGQTKSRTGYDGTSYFGKKNSRLKKIKVYAKFPEMLETIKKNIKKKDGELLNQCYTAELQQFANGLIRWEVSLYHRYFERLGISTYLKDIFKQNTFSTEAQQNYWKLSTRDLFKALEGQTMKKLNNDEVKQQLRSLFTKVSEKTGKISTVLADSAFRTYNDIIRDGWHVTRDSMSTRTFDRHVKMLQESGLSRAALQNMNGLDNGAQIIPFIRFIEVNFCDQFPADYIEPAPKFTYTQKPQLRLVA